jgi:integrase
VSAGEINRELSVLKRMFSLAIQSGRLVHKPHFPMLRENNVRAGFFEREQYLSMLAHLPEDMRPGVTFGYVTGWRINSEVLPLQWRQVDLKAGEVRLDPGTTKNLEGRVFYLTAELKTLLTEQRRAADRIQREKGMIVQHVFFHHPITKAGTWAWPATASLDAASTRRGGGPGRPPGARQHPARPPANGHTEHGPGRHSGARGDEAERSQDAQRLRSL